ncbi:MAG: methyl-accepting chemotaxis protein [Prolixibacteraceae bacterium]
MNKLVNNSDWVSHTQEVLKEINHILGLLKDTETGQRGFVITGEEDYLEPFNNAKAELPIQIERLKTLTSDNENQQNRIKILNGLISQKLEELETTISLRRTDGFESAQKVVISNVGKKVMDEIRVALTEMEDEENSLLGIRSEQNNQSVMIAKSVTISFITLSIVLVIIIVISLTRIIAYPLLEMSKVADELANGNLVNTIKVNSKDEIGMLAASFLKMQNNLRGQLKEIEEGINILSVSSSEIMASATQLASTSAQTSTSIGETTTTVEEVKQTAIVSNQKAKQVSDSAVRSAEISEEGNVSILKTIEGMKNIKLQMNAIASMVVKLSEQSQTIGEITATVTELSEQSNLLAVNAAIEAAKAGEQGKGFSVVAQEIKLLANRSKEATTQVKVILRDVQKSISSAVMATEEGNKAVDQGLKLTNASGDVIKLLTDSVTEASNAAFQIAASSQQQLEGMDQMVIAMESIREASFQAVTSTQQSVNSVSELKQLGEALNKLIEQYTFYSNVEGEKG